MKFTAIAAMSENRVIGSGNRIPWHLPEDFRWFKKMTVGKVLLLGRKTFESIGKPLPNRRTIVLTRHPERISGAEAISDLGQLDQVVGNAPEVMIGGGAEVYRQTLDRCSEIYLTRVKRTIEGDAFFPPFEDQFELVEQVADNPEFTIFHYRRKAG